MVAVDDLSTGFVANVDDLLDRPDFELVEHDVIHGLPVEGPVSAVLHFASAASPPAYLARPIATLEVGSIGTQHALELARKHDGARLLLASTSEVYGDPDQSPQHESYWGNVNPVGPRSVYDEAKRFGEAITMAYHRTYGIDTKIARIFNTYGPFLRPEDGRVDLELPRPGDRRSPAHGVRRRFPDAVVLLRRRSRRRAPRACSSRRTTGR